MPRLTPLWESPRLHVRRFDHADACAECGDGAHEVAGSHIASFVERGRFRLIAEGGSWVLGPGDVMLSRPGMEFRVQHLEEDFSDACLSVCFAAAAQDAHDPGQAWAAGPVRRGGDRFAYLHWGLRRALDDAVTLQAETCAAELWQALAVQRPEPAAGARPAKLAWYAERVHAACATLQARLDEAHRLDDLAAAVHMSPFQFARVFRRLTGVPPHRYLLQARLRRAAAMLADGAGVTAVCFACGFASPSHFARLFRREHGQLPSAWRKRGVDDAPAPKRARNCEPGAQRRD